MAERRRNNRIDAYDEGLKVSDAINDESVGIVGNLSRGGMMLITGRELYADGILQLNIEAPTVIGGGSISVGVKVLWCTPANSPEEYWSGLETVDISPEGAQALERLLDHLAGTT